MSLEEKIKNLKLEYAERFREPFFLLKDFFNQLKKYYFKAVLIRAKHYLDFVE